MSIGIVRMLMAQQRWNRSAFGALTVSCEAQSGNKSFVVSIASGPERKEIPLREA